MTKSSTRSTVHFLNHSRVEDIALDKEHSLIHLNPSSLLIGLKAPLRDLHSVGRTYQFALI